MSLGRQTLNGSFWNFLANSSQQFIQFAFFIFLARILDAGMFGVMALALVSIDLLSVFARLGMLEILVREREDNQRYQQAWLGLVGLGIIVCITLFLLANPVAKLYNIEALAPVIQWLAPLCLLQNLSIVHEARLRRVFAFDKLALRVTTSVIIGGVFGLAFALMGYGLWSLVIQKLVTVIVQSALLWAMDSWRPIYKVGRFWQESYSLFSQGSQLMVGQFLQILNTRAVDVMVGLFLGVVALGYLKIAWKIFDFLLQFAIQPIVGVAISTFSRMAKDTARLEQTYLRMVQVTALIAVPMFFGVAAVAPTLIPFLFGPNWQPSVPLMQGMSLLPLAAIINLFFVPLMIAVGRTQTLLRQSVLQTTLSIVFTLVAAQFHLLVLVLAHVLRAWLVSALNIGLQSQLLGFSVRRVLGVMTPPVLVGAIMAVAVWSGGLALNFIYGEGLPPILLLTLQIGLGGVLYGAGMWLLFKGWVLNLWLDTRALLPKQVISFISPLIR